MFTLNGGVLSWKSSKRTTIADSMIEAEYIIDSDSTNEAVWLKKFITNLDVIPSDKSEILNVIGRSISFQT